MDCTPAQGNDLILAAGQVRFGDDEGLRRPGHVVRGCVGAMLLADQRFRQRDTD